MDVMMRETQHTRTGA